MRILVVLILCAVAGVAQAQDWEDRRLFGAAPAGTSLRVLSSTDTDLFAPLIDAIVQANPGLGIEYLVTNTADIDRRMRDTPDAFDIVISSAMDLQLKLANDGYARAVEDLAMPGWAQWRRSLFAFTAEPAAIVVNRAAFDGLEIPRSRQDLIEVLRAWPNRFDGKVGTYDVRASGLGYLFATQDARASETFWRLMEVMGGLGVKLYCCSGEMIDDLITGEIAVAYNVLGSYAGARTREDSRIEVVLPHDFRTTMMRTVLISRTTQHPEAAETFLRGLLAYQSAADGRVHPLPPLLADPFQGAIPLEPALMTFLDTLKRKKFLDEWEDALIQN